MGAGKLIDKEIMQYIQHLNTKQKLAVLGLIKNFAALQQDWWDKIGKEQQDAIDASLAEIKAGKLITHDQVLKNYQKINQHT
jgi:predicted transcriptional regulator